jgi:succinate dehydrogenase/fumarate reductase flavoprotein subunit
LGETLPCKMPSPLEVTVPELHGGPKGRVQRYRRGGSALPSSSIFYSGAVTDLSAMRAEVIEADVVVVGGGMAGLVAAVAAQEDGASVVCLEKTRDPGGSFALSGGYVWSVGTLENYRALAPEGDQQLGRVLIEDLETGVEWLREHGVTMSPIAAGMGRGKAFGGQRVRPDTVTGGVRPLLRSLEAAGGSLLTGCPAVGLVQQESGAVSGVLVRETGRQRRIAAKAVVLATGGFQGDLEMTTRYIGPWADRAYLRAYEGNTGDGLRLGLSAGAAVSRGMSLFYGHLFPAPPARIDPAAFRTATQFYSEACIVLNKSGIRFTDESLGDDVNALRLIREPSATGFIVFDHERHQHETMEPHVPDAVRTDPVVAVRAIGGVVLEEPSVEALAHQLLIKYSVPARNTIETMSQFDAAGSASRPEDLTVPRSRGLHRIATPPFYAVPVRPGITFTEGGLRVNDQCQVLDRDAGLIGGLFAAGADVGAVSAEGYVGGLSAALVTGLRAGIHAARASELAPAFG